MTRLTGMAAALVLGALGTLAPALADAAGPFGFEMGMTLKQVQARGLKPEPLEEPGTYRTASAPKPHPAFEGYLLAIDPKLGLVSVTGVGKDVACRPTGAELRKAFKVLKLTLVARYGEPQEYDGLEPGSELGGPDEWMAALVADERALALFWGLEPGPEDRPLPDHIARIALVAYASQPEVGYLKLTYEFTNQEAAEAAASEAVGETL